MAADGRGSLRVTLVASSDATFVRRDRKILSEAFRVHYVPWNGKRSLPRLAWSVLRSDVVLSWFALDHAYVACRLAKVLGKKSAVVVGGVDAARVPEIGYGAHIDPGVAARSRYALAHSDRVLLVDESLRADVARNAGVERSEIVTIPLGFDTDTFRPPEGPRTNVLTAGIVSDTNLRRKGLETFVNAARELPDLPFVLVGATPSPATERLKSLAPPNVRFLPIVPEEQLLEEYRKARVYVQVSEYEGLPSALGEAMACGCVPVGTRVAGIPNLIGDTGPYVPVGDPHATALAIRTAYDRGDGAAARARIVERFSIERRAAALREIVEDLGGRQGPRD